MEWLKKLLVRWRERREESRRAYAKWFAERYPGHQWILVRAGTAEQSRSPMLEDNELREWFREAFPNFRIVHLDEENRVLFYE